MTIPLSRPDIGEREIAAVTRVLRSGKLSLGPVVDEFEKKFAAFVGTRYAVATSSGTAALHLCVKALGIEANDEVLTTSFSFVASTNCFLYEGAQPAFADIDPVSLNLDVGKVREAIDRNYAWNYAARLLLNRTTGRPLRAILPVHVFGMPCQMDSIREIAQTFNLGVIEDACEALGAEYLGRRTGTFGDAAAFAFYPNKQMTTAEGGMVVTNERWIAEACRSLRNQGRDDIAGWLRHAHLGYNYRLSDVHCALGIAQLERIEELLARRARVARVYSRLLSEIAEIAIPCDLPEAKRSWFVYVIRFLGSLAPILRDAAVDGLRKRGIACQTYFQAIHRQPYFRIVDLKPTPHLPRTEAAAETCLALPFFSTMADEQVSEVCTALREILAERTEGSRIMAAPSAG